MAEAVAPHAPIVVIGVGNALRGDDGAGIAVVRRLRAQPGVQILEQSGEATALLGALRGAEVAIVVDAAAGTRPGRVRRLDASAEPLPHGLFACSTHGFGVAEGIELARALGTLPRRCVVYALEGARFEAGAPASPAVETSIARAAAGIEAELDAIRASQAKARDACSAARPSTMARPRS